MNIKVSSELYKTPWSLAAVIFMIHYYYDPMNQTAEAKNKKRALDSSKE